MGEPSKNPFQISARPGGNAGNDDSVSSGLAELGKLARQAFEEKRRRQCLAIANAILKIEPENKEALVLHSWITADLQKDFETAQTFVTEARADANAELYERAERLLRSILTVDTESEQAQALLLEVTSRRLAQPVTRPPREEQEDIVIPPTGIPIRPEQTQSGGRWIALVLLALISLIIFGVFSLRDKDELPVVQMQKLANTSEQLASPPNNTTGVLDLFVLPVTGVALTIDNSPAQVVPRTLELSAGPHELQFTAQGYFPETVSQIIVAGKQQALPIMMRPVDNIAAAGKAAGPRGSESQPPAQAPSATRGGSDLPSNSALARPADRPANVAAMGSLVLSAVVPVEVYRGGEHLGTTPVTLQLRPGQQTLEYRYQGLKKTASYVIRFNEITRATIVFEVDLQINARPWAQVFVEGLGGGMLGQTPLGNVKVSVGSVLVFQHPNFPEKRYVVTGNDTNIRVEFP